MKIDEILELISGLSKSQGFYGRLLEQLLEVKENDPLQWEEIVKTLETENFKEPLDVILYFEQ